MVPRVRHARQLEVEAVLVVVPPARAVGVGAKRQVRSEGGRGCHSPTVYAEASVQLAAVHEVDVGDSGTIARIRSKNPTRQPEAGGGHDVVGAQSLPGLVSVQPFDAWSCSSELCCSQVSGVRRPLSAVGLRRRKLIRSL